MIEHIALVIACASIGMHIANMTSRKRENDAIVETFKLIQARMNMQHDMIGKLVECLNSLSKGKE